MLVTALTATLLAALSACSDDAGDDSGGAGVVTQMNEAIADQTAVRLTLGTKQTPDDITINTTLGADRSFRAVTGGDPTQRIDVRLVDDRVYVGGELVGNQWTYVAVDDPRLTGEGGFDAGIVPPLLDIDVVEDNQALADAVTGTESAGTETIHGVETDHHVLTVDTRDWFKSLPEGSIYRQMDLPDTIEMDLYVDADSLPVRLAYEVPDNPEQSAQVGYSRWGTPVEVAVPPRATPVE